MQFRNCYKSHNFSEISKDIIGENVKVAGWVLNKRDHGGVIFLDLKDHYKVLQIVVNDEKLLNDVSKETVISIEGIVRERSKKC